MSGLEKTSNELVIRATGEIVDLEDYRQCGFALDTIRQLEQELRLVKTELQNAIAAESKRAGGMKTLALGDGRKLVIRGGPAFVYDGKQLKADLLAAGMPAERVAQIVEEVVTYKVSAAKAKLAANATDDYRFAVESNRAEVQHPWQVGVERSVV
jgi:hypothetical protein